MESPIFPSVTLSSGISASSFKYAPPMPNSSPPAAFHFIPLLLGGIMLVFFCLIILTIFLCRYLMHQSNMASGSRRNSSAGAQTWANELEVHGLDPSILNSYPTFSYSLIKNVKREKIILECAICLHEFIEEDVIRFLTLCNHGFHQDCIDTWLRSQTTCPICRKKLDSIEKTPEINFLFEQDDEEEGEATSSRGSDKVNEERTVNDDPPLPAIYLRSHSTGHSLSIKEPEADPYMSRSPENTNEKIYRYRNWTSYVAFIDFAVEMAVEKNDPGRRRSL